MPAESHLLAGLGLEPGVRKQELVLEIKIPEEAAVQSSQLLIKTMLNVFLMSIVCRKNEKQSRPKFIPAGDWLLTVCEAGEHMQHLLHLVQQEAAQ